MFEKIKSYKYSGAFISVFLTAVIATVLFPAEGKFKYEYQINSIFDGDFNISLTNFAIFVFPVAQKYVDIQPHCRETAVC